MALLRKKVCWIKWDMVCKSKKDGGLGVKELEMFNDSLLSNWRWRLLQDEESMWSRFLSFRYGNVHMLPLKLQNRSTSSIWWHDLVGLGATKMQQEGWLKEVIVKRVGEETRTLFWSESRRGIAASRIHILDYSK